MIDLSFDADVKERLAAPWRRRLRHELHRMVTAAERAAGGGPLEAAFRLCGDPVIHALNRTWRAKNKPTDVLAFALREGEGASAHGGALGDVVISLARARRLARRRGAVGLHAEVLHLASHGLCHLLGYDHRDDAEEATMNARMAALLAEAARRGTIKPA